MNGEQTELKFLTLAEAAMILQVSKRTILRMIQKKEVPALKVGGQWRLRESQLKRWAEEKESSMSVFEKDVREIN
jgi:PTS system nitrogen regulatory IIA component